MNADADNSTGPAFTTVMTQGFLALIALISIVTLVRSTPFDESTIFGKDAETISGLRSTTEVFRQGGVYVLHDYSMTAPECSSCEPLQVRMETNVASPSTGLDFFDRAMLIETAIEYGPSIRSAVIQAEPLVLVGEHQAPELPPPRA